MAKYEDIALDIKRSIEDQGLVPGDRLPTVVELCELYGVSKITVRKAIEQLVEQGYVSSRRGSGTFVKASPETMRTIDDVHGDDALYFGRKDRSTGFTTEHQDGVVTSTVYTFDICVPPETVARRLDLAKDDFAYHNVRVRNLDGVPIALEDTYMPLDRIPGLKRTHSEGSIYGYMRETLGLKLASFHRILRAVKASAEDARRLGLKAGEPLFEIEQIGFLDSGEPFEYSVSKNVGSRYELHDINIM